MRYDSSLGWRSADSLWFRFLKNSIVVYFPYLAFKLTLHTISEYDVCGTSFPMFTKQSIVINYDSMSTVLCVLVSPDLGSYIHHHHNTIVTLWREVRYDFLLWCCTSTCHVTTIQAFSTLLVKLYDQLAAYDTRKAWKCRETIIFLNWLFKKCFHFLKYHRYLSILSL